MLDKRDGALGAITFIEGMKEVWLDHRHCRDQTWKGIIATLTLPGGLAAINLGSSKMGLPSLWGSINIIAITKIYTNKRQSNLLTLLKYQKDIVLLFRDFIQQLSRNGDRHASAGISGLLAAFREFRASNFGRQLTEFQQKHSAVKPQMFALTEQK